MTIKKRYLKSRPICKVTFKLPEGAAKSAGTVNLVGEFNNWDIHTIPMKRLKNGTFTATIDLKRGREYQFRYLIDKRIWENDWNADKYVPTPYANSDNSVVIL